MFLFFLGPNFRHKDFAKNRRMAVRVHWEKRFKLPGIFSSYYTNASLGKSRAFVLLSSNA
ncbi:hypothetical protein B4168_2210 [Anoxybacillus flavithermus]|nr:hypothetical protein B4168_2210 [Anoxybacillus flavithermus]OAO85865.1 hypothetical protein GT23_2768 [Parageobacillus thermoglucosidasius]